MVSDIPVGPRIIVPLAIIEFSGLRGIEYIIGITDVVNPERAEIEKPNVYWIASIRESSELTSKIEGARRAEEGYMVGPYAILAKESMRKNVNTLTLMANSYLDIPDLGNRRYNIKGSL